ncbi:hypothetical protein P22_2639 [Propionispora sp. 2/2-37]|uniref:GGDEF domain-containing protein n=1 Tax=Propionispora sp. 2/2-37 TaxID=1677858 RepID=UPI0006BB685C|nr:GGDEF domain-containing protein [Propionispora sp. 2/2-37]CUH96549.1 hypothetical protein P22_2639 [Propionispora sp. 2/2-37]
MKKIRRTKKDKTAFWQPVVKKIAVTVLNYLLAALRNTPAGILLVAGGLFTQWGALPSNVLSSLSAVSYMMLAFGSVITFAFNRSRAFFLLLTLLLSQLVLAYLPFGSLAGKNTYAAVSVFLPLNIFFFSYISEYGITSRRGKQCFTLLALEGAVLLMPLLTGDAALLGALAAGWIDFSFRLPTPLPDTAVLGFFLTFIFLAVRRRKMNTHFKITTLSFLLAVAWAQHAYPVPGAVAFFYTAAGLIIIISVIQDYYFKAYLDELTGLPSRRSLNEAMLCLDGHYIIAMLDVDFFKKFNDTYGHDAGDDVLRFIAGIMRQFKTGRAFRYGGEEFTILFSGKSMEEAMASLEELRKTIETSKLTVRSSGKTRGKQLSVTVSIGVAEAGRKAKNPGEVIKLADSALYQAKEKGRNCISA